MNEKNYEAIIEAILFTMGESVELDKIAAAIELDKKEKSSCGAAGNSSSLSWTMRIRCAPKARCTNI